jgi:hypothetical protein
VSQDTGEEAVRDIILGSLNAVFEGGAVGEAFLELGKTGKPTSTSASPRIS